MTQTCSRCGKPLDAFAAGGFCVPCVLGSGLSGRSNQSVSAQDHDNSEKHAVAGAGAVEMRSGEKPKSDQKLQEPSGELLARFGDYELLEEIARGGMGIVYKARQISLNRVVALKMILSGQFATKQEVLRFRVEAEAAANLRHPNIVAIYETGEHQGRHFFSMEYVPGPNLSQLVGNRAVSAERAARCTLAIAQAIHYAHSQNTLHRDLKPSNVLVDADDQPRITDFGLMRRLRAPDGFTITGQILGSPNFMPPEQCGVLSKDRGGEEQADSSESEMERSVVTSANNKRAAGPWSDVYGVGAILYHLLSARAPFQAETVQEVLLQLREQDPVSPRLLNPSVPRDLETVCLKCLQKEPDQRYATAQELADDLQRFLRNEPIMARPVRRAELAWRWCRRKPALASALAIASLLLLVLLIGGPILTYRVNRERLRAERYAYSTDMLLAQGALEEANLGKARELLNKYIPANSLLVSRHSRSVHDDLREWEWRYLWRQTLGEEICTLGTHSNKLLALALSPQGEAASASSDQVIKLWDVNSHHAEGSITCPGAPLFLNYDGRGKLIVGFGTVSDSGRQSIGIWKPDLTNNVVIDTHNDSLFAAALSYDQTLVAALGKDWVRIWNTRTGEVVAKPPTDGNWIYQGTVAFSPDGQFLAYTYGDSTLKLWDLKAGRLIASLEGHANTVMSLAFSPEGHWLLSGSLDRTTIAWNLRTKERAATLTGHLGGVTALAISADGSRLVSGSADQRLKVWEMGTWRELATLKGHGNEITCVVISEDGTDILSGSKDQTVRIWDNKPKEPELAMKRPESGFYSAEVSPAGETLRMFYGGSNTLVFFDAATLEERNRFDASILPGDQMATGPDGRILANADREITLWNAKPPELTRHLTSGAVSVSEVRRMTFASTGKLLAAARSDGTLEIWDVYTGSQLHTFTTESKTVHCVVFSRDSSLVAAGSADGIIEVWNVPQKKRLASLGRQLGWINDICIAPDNNSLVTAGSDGRVIIWKIDSQRGTPLNGRMSSYNCVAISTDGRRVGAGENDGTIRIWDFASRQEVAVLRGHTQKVRRLAFHPDGDSLLSVSRDAMRVWRASSLAEIDAQDRVKAGE
jgi:eukaryotic-like serine/threonine-protein kinase